MSKTDNVEVNEEVKSKAPDGGWGWFACLGSSFITLSVRSFDPSFGLIFNNLLVDLKVSSTQLSSVFSIFDACSNFSGIFVGPLLDKFSYRTVAMFGSLLYCTGLMFTAFANSITHIVITYSILSGIGTGFAVASAFVALNTYFDKKRGQAVSFSSAGTAFAMMIVPQAAHFLLNKYGFRGTMLILGAWTLNSFVGACLLRPLKPDTILSTKKSIIKIKSEGNEKNNGDISESLLMNETNENITKQSLANEKNENGEVINKKKRCNIFKIIEQLFAVDLLKNYSYLNVIFGLSLFNVAESNFKYMTSFFLTYSVGMADGEVAFCLTLTAFTDIVARLVLPIIYDRLGFKKRRLFWSNILFLAIGRSIFAESSKGIWLFIILIINGFIRGAVIQNLLLSVSETCSLKSLPSALGLYMVSKGFFSLVLGPLIGYARDYSKSYRVCIHSMNILILILFINWGIEFFFVSIRQRNKSSKKTICTIE